MPPGFFASLSFPPSLNSLCLSVCNCSAWCPVSSTFCSHVWWSLQRTYSLVVWSGSSSTDIWNFMFFEICFIENDVICNEMHFKELYVSNERGWSPLNEPYTKAHKIQRNCISPKCNPVKIWKKNTWEQFWHDYDIAHALKTQRFTQDILASHELSYFLSFQTSITSQQSRLSPCLYSSAEISCVFLNNHFVPVNDWGVKMLVADGRICATFAHSLRI